MFLKLTHMTLDNDREPMGTDDITVNMNEVILYQNSGEYTSLVFKRSYEWDEDADENSHPMDYEFASEFLVTETKIQIDHALGVKSPSSLKSV